jgi:16S rRNA (guanine527-N7)-methyltransferase
MNRLTKNAVKQIAQPYGVLLNREQCELVQNYVALLLHWNKAISLTTITDPEEITRRHFAESFFAVPTVPISEGRLADVGAGAGFPGAAIALVNPAVRVSLIESNSKKVAFLETVRGQLGLTNLEVAKSRVEDCTQLLAGADFITVRAFGQYDGLLRLVHRDAPSSVNMILWLVEKDAAEIASQSGWQWKPRVRIPESETRVLMVGSPLK